MLSKYIKLLITLILFGYDGFSQYGYYSDVMKFSHLFNGGSARIKGIGGATTSLGGDVSSISINPAGVGFFNKKVFSISYKSITKNNSSIYIGESSFSDRSFDKIDNFSILLPVKSRGSYLRDPVNECKDCPKFNVGISYNVIKDLSLIHIWRCRRAF